jgi:transcription initiation factor TFIID subunit 7
MQPTAKKRANGDMDSDDDDHPGSTVSGQPQSKKIKLSVGKTPSTPAPPITPGTRLKVKGVGKPPTRPPGDGYDSEAEDREIDPVIEEQFILRMMPGEHCEYLRDCIREKRIGIPKQMGGADIAMKWLDAESGRRCMITIQGQSYAGVLLDLPTIIEGMKTWDKKAMVKSADICQMLLIFAPVRDEEEAKKVSLPRAARNGYRWPHGLTPPMHDCIHRRFRKRLSKMEIQNKDQEVERLLKADKEAESTKYEFVDESKVQDQEEDEEEYEEEEEEEEYEEEDAEADAEGEMEDYFGDGATQTQVQPEGEAEEDDLDALFEEDFAADAEEDAETSATATGVTDAATPMTATNGVTPVTQTADEAAADEDEGESEEDESEEDGEEGEFGDEEGEDGEDGDQRDRIAGIRKEIAELEKKKAQFVTQLHASASQIMKKRIEQNIKNTDSEILLKKRLVGEGGDDD